MREALVERARLLTFRKGEVVKWAITTNVPRGELLHLSGRIASLKLQAAQSTPRS